MLKPYITSSLIFLLFSLNSLANNISIDGVLNEIDWQFLPQVTKNYQVSPESFNDANENFSYKTINTESGIYIALEAKTSSVLRRRTQENDTEFSNDHFQITLDMNNNAQDAFVFAINHQGNYFDGALNIEKDLDLQWNAEWDYQVVSNNDSWIAEIFIPWNSMSFSLKAENQFGLYISRFDEHTNATYATSAVNPSMNSFYQQFKKYSVKIESTSQLDIFPYLSWNRNIIENDNETSIGAEIFWQPLKGQKLNATINPDFGQVESDELVVNFSAIEPFFAEQRPFFNSNQILFDVEAPQSLTLLHTPRIGGESVYDDDYTAELNTALKYIITQPNYEIGLLSAFENSDQQNKGRDFYALRGQYALGANKIGVSVNHVNTPSIDRTSTVLSTDAFYAVTEDTSLTFGIVKAQYEENNNVDSDIAWWISGSSDITDEQSHEFSLFAYGDNLQLNDIGYVEAINRKQFTYEYEYEIANFYLDSIRDISFTLETDFKTNFQSEKLPRFLELGVAVVGTDEFEYQLAYQNVSSGVDDLITRGNNSMWLPSAHIVELEIDSPEYTWGNYDFEFATGTEGWNGKFYELTTRLETQFSDNLLLGLTLSQYQSDSWIDWDEESIVEEYNFTEQSVEFSINFQIDEMQELRLRLETVVGKAQGLGNYNVLSDGSSQYINNIEDFAFSESAFQLRYRYALSKLTDIFLSYSFAGEFEDEFAEFGKRNLYKKAIDEKSVHNLFAKIRLHF